MEEGIFAISAHAPEVYRLVSLEIDVGRSLGIGDFPAQYLALFPPPSLDIGLILLSKDLAPCRYCNDGNVHSTTPRYLIGSCIGKLY